MVQLAQRHSALQSALTQFRLFPITYKVALSIASVAIISFALFQIPIAWWAFRNGMDAEAWRRYLVFSVISALIPNLLLVLLILRTISRPLQRITLAAVEVAKGSYGTEVDMRRTNDEIGLLADSFNEMSRKMAADIEQLQQDGTISGGMIPKLETCVHAVEAGCEAAVVLDGRVPHAMLLEFFTSRGAGTLIRK